MKVKGLWLRGNTYWFRIMVAGDRHAWNLHTNDLRTAITRAKEKERTLQSKSADTVEAELTKAIDAKLRARQIRDKTARGMKSVVKIFSEFSGPVSIRTISDKKAKEFIQDLRTVPRDRTEKLMSESGVQSYIRDLRSCFSWLLANGRVVHNPFVIDNLPQLPKSPRRDFCSDDERSNLCKTAPNDDLQLILLLGFYAGLRKREIVEARPEWIDLHQKVIHVGKTETYVPKDSEDRAIPLAKPLLDHFSHHGIKTPFLVMPTVPHGKWEYRYDYRAPFKAHVIAQGFVKDEKATITSHMMRRTFASLLVQRGVSIYKVAKWLGDAVAVVEGAYGHLKAYDSEID